MDQLAASRNRIKDIDFQFVEKVLNNLAKHILSNEEHIIEFLLLYESFEVAKDEIKRTLDLLLSISENETYFVKRVDTVASFLPRNQPLYALSCFALVPAMMSKTVLVRAPQNMHYFFDELLNALNLDHYITNVNVINSTRAEFIDLVTERTITKEGHEKQTTDVVIFTGTQQNADELRKRCSPHTLFIHNGSSHNPIVVSNDAEIKSAVSSSMKVQLYNQGQDCASPNSILVHDHVYEEFVSILYRNLRKVSIGTFKDRNNTVGPINDCRDLLNILATLRQNAEWISDQTPGIINIKKCIVEPTIILKPLSEGGNYEEQFSPIFFVQKYENEEMLSRYFYAEKYAKNAGYITIFGNSSFIDSIIGQKFNGKKVLHPKSTIIRNTNLHAPGIERGVCEYGGYGRGASSISHNGQLLAKPTLPQRDIYEYLVKPFL